MTRVIEIRRAGSHTVIGSMSIRDSDLRRNKMTVRLGGVLHHVYFDGSSYYIYQ